MKGLDTGFLDALASTAPAPGGGGASAYAGALASACASMVANITAANKACEHPERMRAAAERLAQLRENLLKLVELDADAFEPVMDAYRMPKDTPEQIAARDLAVQSALVQACEVPLDIMRECRSVVDECLMLAHRGSRLAVTDAGAGAVIAKAALLAASLNIFINADLMTDGALSDHYVQEARRLIDECAPVADEAYEHVRVDLRAPQQDGPAFFHGQMHGKPVAERMDAQTSERVAQLADAGVQPKLAVVRVGERADDLAYERSLLKRADALGIAVELVRLTADCCTDDLLDAIACINADASVHGCLLFRPLPAGIDELAVCNAIDPRKDVDGVGAQSLAGVFMGLPEGFAPCTARACLEMLDAYEVPLAGRNVVVAGRSLVVGRPVSMMLMARHATVTLAHSQTADLASQMRRADIVICATGRARMFGRECFRRGQVVLDVGMNADESGRLCGDVDTSEVEDLVAAITPVPGGIGSITTSVLMRHVVEAAERTH